MIGVNKVVGGIPCSNKVPLNPNSTSEGGVRRTVYYLGSKLRVLDAIKDAISELTPPSTRVCDLFAGSGVVSLALAADWDVTSVDIQEYSRVLCDGLLNIPPGARKKAVRLVETALNGELRSSLRDALGGLLEYERKCLQDASLGSLEGLCDLIEFGSLHSDTTHPIPSKSLKSKITTATDKLRDIGFESGPETVMTRFFGGRYFSFEQSIDFDALLAVVHSTDPPSRNFLLAAVLVTASELVNSIGKQFAQPIRLRSVSGVPKQHLVKQTLRDRTLNVIDKFEKISEELASLNQYEGCHCAVKSDYLDFLRNDNTHFAAVYADPPYTRDHYSRYYHVLETMTLHDEPEVAKTRIHSSDIPRLSRGLYRLNRHQSPFCIPSKAPEAFNKLFTHVAQRETPLVLSYSPFRPSSRHRPRLLTIDQLLDMARKYFREVEAIPIAGVTHNKLNVTKRNVKSEGPAEMLIICRPQR